jgi:hypothetical protein
MPRFIVIPKDAVANWRLTETTTVDGTLNGVSVGRRSLKRLDDGDWFIDLPEPLCRRAGVDTGDTADLSLRVASTALPPELSSLLSKNAEARRTWTALTLSQQRMLREHIASATQSTTRLRRATCALTVSMRREHR